MKKPGICVSDIFHELNNGGMKLDRFQRDQNLIVYEEDNSTDKTLRETIEMLFYFKEAKIVDDEIKFTRPR